MRSIQSCGIVSNTIINQLHYGITPTCIYLDVGIILNYNLNKYLKIKKVKNKKTFNKMRIFNNMKAVNKMRTFNNTKHTKFKFFKLNS